MTVSKEARAAAKNVMKSPWLHKDSETQIQMVAEIIQSAIDAERERTMVLISETIHSHYGTD